MPQKLNLDQIAAAIDAAGSTETAIRSEVFYVDQVSDPELRVAWQEALVSQVAADKARARFVGMLARKRDEAGV